MSHPPPGGPPYPPQQPPWPRQQWSVGPPPKKRGNGWKWALGAVALLAVIGVTVAVTISVTKNDGSDDSNSSANTFGLASADDKGPANVITEDPTCAAWTPINQKLANVTKAGWNDRDPSIAATDWTPEQRTLHIEAGKAMREAADQTVQLAKTTPHRVIRGLYEQFIAYARAYDAAILTYKPADNHLAGVVTASAAALSNLCAAVSYGSAQARDPFLPTPQAPSVFPQLTDPGNPQPFLSAEDSQCEGWNRLLQQYDSNSAVGAWKGLDARIPAGSWNPTQQAVVDAVSSVMSRYADDLEDLGRASANPTFQDLAVLAAQYRRAYVSALPTYGPADSYLSRTSAMTASMVYEACEAAGA